MTERYSNTDFKTAADSPFGRFESAVAAVGGYMYIWGGHHEPELACTDQGYRYDPVADTWTRIADYPVEISHVTAAVIDDRYIWVVGGFEGKHPGTAVAESYRYDTTNDTWSEGPPLPKARGSGGLASINGRLHYFGGLHPDRMTNSEEHWVLDPNGGKNWESLRPMPEARTHSSTAVFNGGIYAIGGHYGHDDPQNPGSIVGDDLDFVHHYDPESDTWTDRHPLPYRRSHCEAGTFVHDGRIYCAGGRSVTKFGDLLREDRPLLTRLRRIALKVRHRMSANMLPSMVDDVLCYDPAKDHWAKVGRMGQQLYCPSAVCIDGEMILTGGGGHGWQEPSKRTIRLKLDTLS